MVSGRESYFEYRRKNQCNRAKIAVGGHIMDEKYIERLVANEQSTKSAHKRIDEAETRIDELEKTYAIMQKMDYRMGRVEDSVEKISQKLDSNYQELVATKTQNTSEKSKKWDKLIDYLFYTIIGAVIMLALTKIGLN